jgi:hypothetical protein
VSLLDLPAVETIPRFKVPGRQLPLGFARAPPTMGAGSCLVVRPPPHSAALPRRTRAGPSASLRTGGTPFDRESGAGSEGLGLAVEAGGRAWLWFVQRAAIGGIIGAWDLRGRSRTERSESEDNSLQGRQRAGVSGMMGSVAVPAREMAS